MGLNMFGQVAWSFEFFVTEFASVNLRLGVLLPPGHGTKDVIIVFIIDIDVTLHRRGGRELFLGDGLACGDTYSLAVCRMTNELSRFAIVTHTPVN